MQESQRIRYLEQMGMTCWIPKQKLAFAPEPRWQVIPAVEAVSDTQQPQPLMSSFSDLIKPDTNSNQRKTVIEGSHSASITPPASEPTQAPAPASAEQKEQSIPKFELCFVRLCQDTLWVCDKLSQKEDLQKLVASMMRAGQQAIDARMPIEFKWPYLDHHKQSQGVEVAKRTLDAQWNILVQDGVKHVFAFGEDSKKWLAAYEVIFLAQNFENVLNNADEKRQLWHDLSEHKFFF